MRNVLFDYMYRDGANYKFDGDVPLVFANPGGLSLENAAQRIAKACDGEEFFIAHQVGVPEVFGYKTGKSSYADDIDHCFHEFMGLEPTDQEPNTNIPLDAFVERFETAAKQGWDVFDPGDRSGGPDPQARARSVVAPAAAKAANALKVTEARGKAALGKTGKKGGARP